MAIQQTHPFFDPLSRYTTSLPDRTDRGAGMIVRLFRDLRRAAMQRYVQSHPGQSLGELDWGYSPSVNRILTASYQSARDAQTDTVRYAADGYGDLPPPPNAALAVVDLDDPAACALLPPLEPRAFPGHGQSPNEFTAKRGGYLTRWYKAFDLDVRGLGGFRRAVVFILLRRTVETMAEIVPPGSALTPWTDGWTTAVLRAALDPRAMDPRASDPGEGAGRGRSPGGGPWERSAGRLNACWAAAPTLVGRTDAAGDLQLNVDLGIWCPTLPPGAVVVVAAGPGSQL